MGERDNLFRVDDTGQCTARVLAPRVSPAGCPGEHAMLSVMRIEPAQGGMIHHHPQERGCIEGSTICFQGGEAIPARKGGF